MSRSNLMQVSRQVHNPGTASLVEFGKVGAIVGLCGAGAHNLHRLRREEIEAGTAVADTLRAGLVSGLAAATAGLVAGAFRPAPLLSLAATIATGTAVAYVLTRKPEVLINGDQHE